MTPIFFLTPLILTAFNIKACTSVKLQPKMSNWRTADINGIFFSPLGAQFIVAPCWAELHISLMAILVRSYCQKKKNQRVKLFFFFFIDSFVLRINER